MLFEKKHFNYLPMEVVWDEVATVLNTWLRYNTTIRTCTHHTYHIALDNKSNILAGDLPYINGFSEITIYNYTFYKWYYFLYRYHHYQSHYLQYH